MASLAFHLHSESPPPYSPLPSPSRSSSTSTPPSPSPSSPFTTSGTQPYSDLQTRALHLLDLLCNQHDLDTASHYLHPNIVSTHDDNPPVSSRAAFLAGWEKALSRTPDFRAEVCEACVDERQRKVWICSEISFSGDGNSKRGPVRKESVDMLVFDEQGRVVSSSDCQRVVSRRRRERRRVDGDDY